MADYAGTVQPAQLVNDRFATTARRFDYQGGVLPTDHDYGVREDGNPTAPVVAGNALPGLDGDYYSSGFDWFDKVHLIPRDAFNFGAIVSQSTEVFEIFNAWKVPITFSSFLNSAGSGVTIPDLPTPPVVMDAFTSLTDPDSTRLSYTGLELIVDRDGEPVFDTTLDFGFSTGESLGLALSGSRITILLPVYESQLREVWDFPSDSIESDDGSKDVLSLAGEPLQTLQLNYRLDGTDRQRLQTVLHGGMAQIIAIPVWYEGVESTATSSISDTSIAVTDTTDADFRVGGLALIYSSPTSYDVVELSAVATNALTFASSPLLAAYADTVQVVPVRLGYIVGSANSARRQVDLQDTAIAFRVTDNTTGMFAESTAGWSTYDGKILFDDCNVLSGSDSEQVLQKVYALDSAAGSIELLSDWGTSRKTASKTFSMRTRAQFRSVKQLLLALRGPQKTFRIPTFTNDLTATQDITAGINTITIENIGYYKLSLQRAPKDVIRVTFADGTTLERTITASALIDLTEEILTVDTNWPDNRTVAEISRIEFLELTRFATNRFVFRIDYPLTNRLTAATETVL